MLSTVQNHHPGEFGDQQHIWQATLSKEVTVFSTHPACPVFDNNDRNFSPAYWVGNGIMPHGAQNRNVHMSIYNLNKRKGFMERKRLELTHAYFPKDKFHEVFLDKNMVFGRLNNVYIALIGKNSLNFNDNDPSEIIQQGKLTYWICEIGNQEEYVSFKAFCDDIKERKITFVKGTLEYSGKKKLSLTYRKRFMVNDEIINTEYKRYETPYVTAERKPEELTIEYEGKGLYLNFKDRIRRTW
jgi:hypothetical protein